MAIAVLEREISKLEEEKRTSKATAEAQKAFDFNRRISGNYEKLMRADGKALTAEILGEPVVAEKAATLTLERSVAAPAEERVSVRRESAAQTPVSRTPVMTPAYEAPANGRKILFAGLSYKDGEIIDASAPAVAPVKAPEETPAYRPAYRPAPAPVAVPERENEDALPTRRTMDTLRREATASVATEATSTFQISAKAKAVIAVLVLAIVVAIAVICANTAIINTLNAEISSIESASAQLESRLAGLQEQITEVRSEENVIQFAEEMGMVLRP